MSDLYPRPEGSLTPVDRIHYGDILYKVTGSGILNKHPDFEGVESVAVTKTYPYMSADVESDLNGHAVIEYANGDFDFLADMNCDPKIGNEKTRYNNNFLFRDKKLADKAAAFYAKKAKRA
jgi:hypothetical protein